MTGLALVMFSSVAEANLGDPNGGPERPLDPGSPQPVGPRLPGGPGLPPELEPEPGGDEPGPLPLFPRVPLGRVAGWIFPPEPQPSDREEEAEANLERYLDEQLDRDRLDAGRVDGWYHGVGRAMREQFRPDRQRIEGERHRGMTLLQRAWDELGRYAAGPGRPQDVPGQTLPEQRRATNMTTDTTDRGAAVEQEAWDICNPLNAAVTWYRVDLRVTHNPEGELSAAWVLRSSGIEALDDAALAAVRGAGAALLPPPENVVGERMAIRSDWAFEMGDVATLPVCMTSSGPVGTVSCVDDPVLGTTCAFAGRGIIRTRVSLLAVLDADHPSPEERRAERRRERTLDN